MNTTFWKGGILWVVVGLIVGVGVGMAIGWRLADRVAERTGSSSEVTNATDTEETGGDITVGNVSVSAVDQVAGRAVTATNVTLPVVGWLAVHEVRSGGVIGNILGAARREAGTYESVIINLLRGTTPDGEYAIIVYADNGNREFDLKADLPIAQNGAPVVARFTATTPVRPAGQ